MYDPSDVNNSFSKITPGMQIAIDSTSLGVFKTCPMKYRLEIVEGWTPKLVSEHLTFGILLHQAREHYEHAKAKGADHEHALDAALEFVLKATWNQKMGRPWISSHATKNRLTLIQTTVWYLDEKAQDDPLETVILKNGKPAVELSFRFDSGVKTLSSGESIFLCGHLDRLAQLGINSYVPDIKTSSSDVTKPNFAKQFSPHNQFSLYSIAGKVAFDFDVAGVMVDGVQVGVGFARFRRAPILRSPEYLDEWMKGFEFWVRQMEQCAVSQHWPQNDTACDKFGGCVFRETCSRSPASREKWLAAEFNKRVWDPMVPRGE